MARGNSLYFTVGADIAPGSKAFDSLARKAARSMGDIDDALSGTKSKGQQLADAINAQMDEIKGAADDTAEAAIALGRALGPELVSKIDLTEAATKFQKLGLTVDDIKADAEALADVLRRSTDGLETSPAVAELEALQDEAKAARDDLEQIGKVDVSPLEGGTRRAAGGVDDLGRSADSSKSVLANLVGNSVQDLGALGGVAGSAGVAIGQVGEYMADAAGEGDKLGQIVRGFGGIAVPLAAVAIATQAISGHFEKMAEDEKFATEQMQRFSRSIQEGASEAQILRNELEQTGKLEFKVQISGPDIDVDDITGSLAKAGLDIEEFVGLSKISNEEFRKWADAAEAAGVPTKDLAAISLALAAYQQQEASAAANAANTNAALGKEVGTQRDAILAATEAEKRRLAALKESEAAVEAADNTQRYLDQAQGMRKLVEATEDYNRTVSSADFGKAELEGALTANSNYTDQLFFLADRASQAESAIDAFGDSIKDSEGKVDASTLTLDANTDAGRRQIDAIKGIADSLEVEFASAYDQADGDMFNFMKRADTISNNTLKRLQTEFGLSDDQVEQLRGTLGLTAKDWKARFEMSGTEDARLKLGLLQTSIDNLPKDVQATVTQKILTGDYVGALATVQGYFNRNPATLPVNLRVSTASLSAAQMAAFNAERGRARGGPVEAGQAYVVGEKRPELFIPDQDGTIIPRVPSSRTGTPVGGGAIVFQPNITINAGVGTDPRAIERHTLNALQEFVRRNGPGQLRRMLGMSAV